MLAPTLADLAWAYAHMFATRLFSHSAREHELAIHELLRRYLAAERARATQHGEASPDSKGAREAE